MGTQFAPTPYDIDIRQARQRLSDLCAQRQAYRDERRKVIAKRPGVVERRLVAIVLAQQRPAGPSSGEVMDLYEKQFGDLTRRRITTYLTELARKRRLRFAWVNGAGDGRTRIWSVAE